MLSFRHLWCWLPLFASPWPAMQWVTISQPVPGRHGKSGAAAIKRAARRRKARRA